MTTANAVGAPGYDPYPHCEGMNFSKLGLTTQQVSRIHALRRRQGLGNASCTHDLAQGRLISEIRGMQEDVRLTSATPRRR